MKEPTTTSYEEFMPMFRKFYRQVDRYTPSSEEGMESFTARFEIYFKILKRYRPAIVQEAFDWYASNHSTRDNFPGVADVREYIYASPGPDRSKPDRVLTKEEVELNAKLQRDVQIVANGKKVR